MKMQPMTTTRVSSVLALLASTTSACAGLTSFTEQFDAGASNWFNAAGDATVQWVSGGGPSGAGDAYVSTTFDFGTANADDPFVIFRGQDEFNSSGNAFVGDWISSGLDEFSFWIRHDATEAIAFFARIASPDNFPAVNAIAFAPVAPNTWTQITFAIEPGNPALIFEGPASTFSSVFGNVGHVQIGFQTPAGLAGGDSFTFDLDGVSTVPAPSAALLIGAGLAWTSGRRRRSR